MIDIPECAKKYIGIPYEKYGSDFSGCDCLGLVQIILKEELGVILPDYVHTDPKESELTGLLVEKHKSDWERLNYPELFSVINFNIVGHPIHFGVVLSDDYMIHSMKGHNSVLERYTGSKWKNRVEGFYKWHCM